MFIYSLSVSGIRVYQFVDFIVCVFQVSGRTRLLILLSVCFRYQGVPVCSSYCLCVLGIRVHQFVHFIVFVSCIKVYQFVDLTVCVF